MPRRFEREEEHSRERGERGGRPPAAKKSCRFCANPFDPIDYKNERQVRRLVSERGKILPRRAT
ncbi:MAG: 30S ribosomal protein S18, partial [candidate division Zixibacteria bacterium]|nr:30S ribosomal protein S18 [candidate division Zixibacteria bacterium]